jgi:hypothetical protein
MPYSSSETDIGDREYEEGTAGTNLKRKSDPLKEYLDEEPMTPAKIITHDPTAVHRDSGDQHITTSGHTGVNSEKAMEQYRKHGMTKIEN